MKKVIFFASLALAVFVSPGAVFSQEQRPITVAPEVIAALEELPVQHGGRIKPFRSYAGETVLYITGKSRYRKLDQVVLVFDWMAATDSWIKTPVLPMAYKPLEEKFGLRVIEGKISPENVLLDQKFMQAARELSALRGKNEKLSTFQTKELDLLARADFFRILTDGRTPAMIPDPSAPDGAWIPLAYLAHPEGLQYLKRFYSAETVESTGRDVRAFMEAWGSDDGSALTPELTKRFTAALRTLYETSGVAIDFKTLETEASYHRLRPFHHAWLLYGFVFLLAWILSAFEAGKGKISQAVFKFGSFLVAGIFLISILLHTYGIYLRVVISGRPPVTNMYESMIWVSWVAAVFAMIYFSLNRNLFLLKSASIVSALVLMLAERFPAVFDPAIDTLVPVLRSNLWLTVHVLTITMSYGAFALAWGIGHGVITKAAFSKEPLEALRPRVQYVHRILMVGVVLLAAGTILGGVWANYSWGRYWGWDPKETWALIALLGYLAVLHGRFAGWLGSFGLAAGAVAAFLGVVMAWYGVNYVLGAGLHSYGFGGGGASYVMTVALMDLTYVFLCAFFFRRRMKLQHTAT